MKPHKTDLLVQISLPMIAMFSNTKSNRLVARLQVVFHRRRPFREICYNLISIPQITRALLEDTIISSKTNPCSGSTKQKRSNG